MSRLNKFKSHRIVIIQILTIYLLVGSFFLLPVLGKESAPEFSAKEVAVKSQGITLATDTLLIPSPEIITAQELSNLSIPSLNLNLTVKTGGFDINTQEWILDDEHVFFSAETDLPNNISGNSLIYAHNRNNLFYPTKDLQLGDKAIITDNAGREFIYEFTSREIVPPTDLNIFSYSGKPQLTLLTCNGWYSENRSLMYFQLIEIN